MRSSVTAIKSQRRSNVKGLNKRVEHYDYIYSTDYFSNDLKEAVSVLDSVTDKIEEDHNIEIDNIQYSMLDEEKGFWELRFSTSAELDYSLNINIAK